MSIAPSIVIGASLDGEYEISRGRKVCSYSDGSTITISSFNSCPYSSFGAQQPQRPSGTSIGDLKQMGPESLVMKYCSLASRQKALSDSGMKSKNVDNPLAAQMQLNTAVSAAKVESEKIKVGGVLESKYGIYMDDSMCN
jgi:hypothetical protein